MPDSQQASGPAPAEINRDPISQAALVDVLAVVTAMLRQFALPDSDFKPEWPQLRREHGHALMIKMLLADARARPGTLAGRTLIEVGMTREAAPFQCSTEKLGFFARVFGLNFISVDVDPLTVAASAARQAVINPASRLEAVRGEQFLAAYDQPIDYLYLDAYDFDHPNHSRGRRDRYVDLLGADISDAACWEMHLDCARSARPKLTASGVIVVDDSWLDDAGEHAGKGRLAIPYLLSEGFTIEGRHGKAVALRAPAAP